MKTIWRGFEFSKKKLTPNNGRSSLRKNTLSCRLTRYRGGITSYLEVTTAQSAALVDEVTAVNILGRRLTSAVLLIQALGGGWDRRLDQYRV